MFSLSIVISFDVFEYLRFSGATSHVSLSVNQLDFQCVKKALHRRIVVAGGFATHAAAQTIVFDQSLISL